jgi:hypothetical protein
MRELKRFSHRNWAVLRDSWIEHIPAIDFAARYPEPTLWQLPTIVLPEFNASGIADAAYIEGVREAIFREAIILSRKFIYCASVLPILAHVGKNTSTAMTAYEASFYGAKAFCYLLGFANLGRNSKCYVDAFIGTERKVGKVRTVFYESLRYHQLKDRLTHEVLWALTARLIDTTSFDGDLREIQGRLKLVDWEKFTGFRNVVYYDGSFWPLSDDVRRCDIITDVKTEEFAEAAWLDLPTSTPFAGHYFETAALFRALISAMLANMGEIAPALKAEADAFDVLKIAKAAA